MSESREAEERAAGEGVIQEAGKKRLESLGRPHCARREVVAWGRANGAARQRCKACARTFNALTSTPMARLRKKERWPVNAQAMIEATSVAKAAER